MNSKEVEMGRIQFEHRDGDDNPVFMANVGMRETNQTNKYNNEKYMMAQQQNRTRKRGE